MIDLNAEIKNIKGIVISVNEERPVKDPQALTPEIKTQLESIINTITDEVVKRAVLAFALDYVAKTELVTRTVTVRDVLQTLVSSIAKPSPRDQVKQAKLLPKLDDSAIELDADESDRAWLVKSLVNADESIAGSTIKARMFNVLDPDGTLLEVIVGDMPE